MQVIVSKYAGFCFGVDSAVNTVFDIVSSGHKCCTLGEVVHNPSVIEKFKSAGGLVVNSLGEVPKGCVLVLRSHGVGANTLKDLRKLEIRFVDATCPFVKKIHNIVSEYSKCGFFVLVAGDASHCEVQGIVGNCFGPSAVFKHYYELEEVLGNRKLNLDKCVVVAQTTFSVTEWRSCCKLIKKISSNIKIFDTVCSATNFRQKEAEELSKKSDVMVVLGGCNSSNSLKLKSICEKYCKTFFVERPECLECESLGLDVKNTVGITAGASVPHDDVLKVKKMLVDFKRREYGFRN